MSGTGYPANVRIVLCRPKYAANIGFVCRAMKTMGLSELAIVGGPGAATAGGGGEDVGAGAAVDAAGVDAAVLATAVHAADVYRSARRFDSVEEAVADCVFVAGTTRRRGKRRKRAILLPEEFAAMAAEVDGPVALLFGNEETGLTAAELDLCAAAVTIPTDAAFPSLNLSHAVQIMTYALNRQRRGPASTPVTAERLGRAADSIVDHLSALDHFDLMGPAPTRKLLHDILGRARVTEGELRELERIFRKLRYRAAPHDSRGQS